MKDKDHLKKFDRTGTKHTEESKEKMRQAKLGKKRTAKVKEQVETKGAKNDV